MYWHLVVLGAVAILCVAAMPTPAVAGEPGAIRTGPWELAFDAETGDWQRLRWNGEVVAENTESVPSIDIEAPRGRWVCSAKPHLVSRTWDRKEGVLSLVRRVGPWELEERIAFGAGGNPNRIERTLHFTFRPTGRAQGPAKFYRVRFMTSLPKRGTYLFPARPFDERRRGDCQGLPEGSRAGSAWGVWPFLLQQAEDRTLLFVGDARRDRAHTFMRSSAASLHVAQDFIAQGWAEPNVTQTVGPAYLEIATCGLEEALRTAVWRWYDDVGLKVPEGRPSWTREAVLYSFHPGGTIGSDFRDLGGFRAAEEELLPNLKRMGFTAVWLLPLEDRGCYWPRDYYRFQEGLGTSEEYRSLVARAHELGIKVWQDNVPHGGSPGFGRERGNEPWWLVFDEKGDAMDYWCFDFREPEWQRYIAEVAGYYCREFDIDGYRVDAVGGSHGMNWRRAGFPPAERVPANVPADWWRESLEKVGGRVPPLPYERGSLTLREGGLGMLRAIRDAVKRQKPEAGAVLAEVQHPPYMQEADVVYDFALSGILMQIRRRPPAEFVPGLESWLEEQKCSEPRGTVRLRYVESHDTVRARGWYGLSATRALTALTVWIDGMPMIYHDSEIGQGPYLQRVLAVRAALPELNTGEAFYESIKADPPCVFTCLRTLEGKASVVLVNLSPERVDATVPVPAQELSLKAGERLRLWDVMSGAEVAEGAPDELRTIGLPLEAWAATVLCLRPASDRCPLAAPEPALTPAAPAVTRPELLPSGRALEVRTGQYRLTVDRHTGLIRSFTDGTHRQLLGACELICDPGDAPGGEAIAESSLEHTRSGAGIELRGKLLLKSGGGVTLTYRCLPDRVELDAVLDEATPGERAGLVFAGADCRRYQVNTAEGLLDDWFVVRHASGKAGGSHGIYYRPQGTEVVWQAETCPLDAAHPFLRTFAPDGSGVELRLVDPLRAGVAGVYVLDRFAGRAGWHAAFLWRDTARFVPCLTARQAPVERAPAFTISLRPTARPNPVRASSPQAPKPAGVSVSNTSLDWAVENEHYRLLLRRTGGVIRSLWSKRPELRLVLRGNDVYTDKGFRTEHARHASAGSDGETGVRVWRDESAVRMRFGGMIRGESRFGRLRPPIWFVIEYAFDSSPTFRVRWSVLSEGDVRLFGGNGEAFLAWVARVPEGREFTFRRGGRELTRGAFETRRRTGETANLPGAPVPDTVILMDGDGSALATLGDLRMESPEPLHNVFVHGSTLFLAWLDVRDRRIVPGEWYEASLAVTPGAGGPGDAPPIPWTAGSLPPRAEVLDPSFEQACKEVLLVSEGRWAKFLEGPRSAWSVPRGGSVTNETAHSGRSSAKVVNTTGEYLLFTQRLRPALFPAGSRLRLCAWVRGENIVRGDPAWKTGIVGLAFRLRDGKHQYRDVADLVGSFDWRKVEGVIAIPENAAATTIRVGLNGARGTMWIDDVVVTRLE